MKSIKEICNIILKPCFIKQKGIGFNKKAFTILEIFVVLGIMAVLTLVSFSYYKDYMEEARQTVRITNMKLINEAISRYYKENSVYPKYVDLKVDSTEKGVLLKYLNRPLYELLKEIIDGDKEYMIKYRVTLPSIKNITVSDLDVANNNLEKLDYYSNEGKWISDAEFKASADPNKNLYCVNEIIATFSTGI